jgi:soluble lytic murein transglycosylase-like protein
MPTRRPLIVALLVSGGLWAGPSTTSLAGGGRFTEAATANAKGDDKAALKALPATKLLDPEGRLLRARLLVKLRKFKEARKLLQKLLAELPHMRDLIRYLQAETAFGQRRYFAAAQLFRAAARSRRSRWVDLAWIRRADSLMAAKQYVPAAREYKHLLNIYPGHPRRAAIELARAVCLMRGGQRLKAAAALREVWLRRPVSAAAKEARKHLDQLLTDKRIRIRPTPFWRLIQRIRVLRRNKRFDEALASLKALKRGRLSAIEAARVERERAWTQLKRGAPDRALAVLTQLYRKHKSRSIRRDIAGCHARLGRVDKAVKLIRDGRRWRRGRDSDLRRAAVLLATYGRHKKSLALYDLLAKRLSPAKAKALLATRTWLAYRAGQHRRAIKGFAELARRSRSQRPKYYYWQARALDRAGRAKEAQGFYQKVTERHLRTYYGLLARSRLLEAKKLTLPTTPCPTAAEAPSFVGDPKVAELLDKLVLRDGQLYPSLRRVRTFWRLGMVADARRELWLIGIDFAWVRAHGRPRYFVHRPEAERTLRGAVPPKRRFKARERKIYKERLRLASELGELMQRAGIFYFAWRFLPRDGDPVRRVYPRGYPALVQRTAKRYGLDPNVLWAIMKTESSFRTDAVSRAGATGLMQIMPSTGRRLAAEMKLSSYDHSQLYNPQTNVTMAGWYLGAVLKKFAGQLTLAAAGYNGGPHNVALWLDQRGAGAEIDEFIEEIPFSESRRYAKKILRLTALYERTYCGKDDRTQTTKLTTSYLPYPAY